jgi:hypothetical protein
VFDESSEYVYEPVPDPPEPVRATVLLLGLNAELSDERLTAFCVACVIAKVTLARVIV